MCDVNKSVNLSEPVFSGINKGWAQSLPKILRESQLHDVLIINRVCSGKRVNLDVFCAPRACCQNVIDERGKDRNSFWDNTDQPSLQRGQMMERLWVTSKGKEADFPCIS